jgi:hypothetical protein
MWLQFNLTDHCKEGYFLSGQHTVVVSFYFNFLQVEEFEHAVCEAEEPSSSECFWVKGERVAVGVCALFAI